MKKKICSAFVIILVVFYARVWATIPTSLGLDTKSFSKNASGPQTVAYRELDLVEKQIFSLPYVLNLDHASTWDNSKRTLADNVQGQKINDLLTLEITQKTNTALELMGNFVGTIKITSAAPLKLILNGISLRSTNGPSLVLNGGKIVYLELAEKSKNSLVDSSTRQEALDEKANLVSKGRLVISGNGSLEIKANYKHGIYAKEFLRIRSGVIDIAVAALDGIRTQEGFVMDGGSLHIVGTGKQSDKESKGIKVEGIEKGSTSGKLIINGGSIQIKTVGKGLSAGWSKENDATNQNTDDDPDPDLEIHGGYIKIETTGTPYARRLADGSSVSSSPEGLEAKSDIRIRGGYIEIMSTDDGINGGESIEISGGYLLVSSTNKDAIDSNGPLKISGGVVVAYGSRAPEGPFDCDQNSFTITGGTVLGFGGSTSEPSVSGSSQGIVVAQGGSANTSSALLDKNGTLIAAWKQNDAYPTMVFSFPGMKVGETYSLKTGVTLESKQFLASLALGNGSAATSKATGGKEILQLTQTSIMIQKGGEIFGKDGFGPGAGGGRPARRP